MSSSQSPNYTQYFPPEEHAGLAYQLNKHLDDSVLQLLVDIPSAMFTEPTIEREDGEGIDLPDGWIVDVEYRVVFKKVLENPHNQ